MSVKLSDVAEAAKVSVGTVSNVLNSPSKVAAATVERVTKVIEELGYVRNDAARQLRVGRSRSVGFIVPNIANPYFGEVVRGAEARAMEHGLTLLVGSSTLEESREDSYIDTFIEQQVSGIVVTHGRDPERFQRIAAKGTPVVMLGAESASESIPSVSVNDEMGGYLAASHLINVGRTRIAFVGGPLSTPAVTARLDGARRAVREALPSARVEVIELSHPGLESGRNAGNAIKERRPDERPDAVFTMNDFVAFGVLQAFLDQPTISVPDDIALIGYDDVYLAAAAAVPLSSIRQPAALMGHTAIDLLVAQLTGSLAERDSHIRFTPELVTRRSTATYRARISAGPLS